MRELAVVLMGVTGSGKTSVGERLAERLGCSFFDADDFHPAANVDKMRSGVPLNDEDRAPWLDRLRELIASELAAGRTMVLACSALRRSYRARLTLDCREEAVVFVYLRITPEAAQQRLMARAGHYMPATLVPSQFEALEEPEAAIVVDATQPLELVVDQTAAALPK